MEKELDRTSGFHFLLYALYGENFENRIGTTMSDDQRMLHALIQRLEGGGSAEVVLVDQNVGEVDAGKEIDIDLKSYACRCRRG